jgi:ribosomal-protein-alanine N-acetyltransferase
MPSQGARRQAVKISLRTYTPEDFEALYKIDQACYEPDVAYSRGELRAYLRFPGADCLVATIRGEPIGFCLTAYRENRGHVITIDILKEYRRHGVGSRLLEAVEQRLAKCGVDEVILETATENHSAIAFWEKHGYRTRGVWKGYYPGGRDAYAMVKSLIKSLA